VWRPLIAGLALAVLVAVPAQAQNVDVPHGYAFCGWKDFVNGGWTYDDPPAGVFAALFARKMSCPTARHKYKQIRYSHTPPYKLRLKGYRCVRLQSGEEYADVRCSRRGHKKVALRFQEGS
jgi:hypothetical protein